MRVFISWSGDTSRQIAQELYEWLPMVVQSIEPYMSSESIEKGTRWSTSIASELEGSSIGIVVLTPENTTSTWIHFEAGALAKIVGDAKLAPLLCGLNPSDIGAPLSQFQVTQFTKADVLKLLKSVNGAAGQEALSEARLEKMHESLWGNLQEQVEPLIAKLNTQKLEPKKPAPLPSSSKVLEEILTLVRQQSRNHLQITQEAVRMALGELGGTQSSIIADKELRSMIYLASRRWIELEPLLQASELSRDLQQKKELVVARLRESFSDLERLTRTARTDHILGGGIYRDTKRNQQSVAADDGVWATARDAE